MSKKAIARITITNTTTINTLSFTILCSNQVKAPYSLIVKNVESNDAGFIYKLWFLQNIKNIDFNEWDQFIHWWLKRVFF